jgi:hypothetical protein
MAVALVLLLELAHEDLESLERHVAVLKRRDACIPEDIAEVGCVCEEQVAKHHARLVLAVVGELDREDPACRTYLVTALYRCLSTYVRRSVSPCCAIIL